MRDSRWAQQHRKRTNPETLTRKFLQLLKQRSKKEKASVSQSAISFHDSHSDMSRYLNFKCLKSFMRVDDTCSFSVYFSKSEMWIVPITKPINWNMGPQHGHLDLDWKTLELEARFLDLFNSSHNLLLIS